MDPLPAEMLSLTALSYTTPSNFTLSRLPIPTLSSPTDVLVKVHATNINPGEIRRATGQLKAFAPATFPHQLGLDLSGTVLSTGDAVTTFKPGDQVFGLLTDTTGAASEYVCVSASTITHQPANVDSAAAAAVPTVGLTVLQAFDYAESTIPGGLRGKTVFVGAGLSGTGSVAVQLAKHVFGAARVITTVSTPKVPRIPELLGEGTVDQVVDYMTQDVLKVVEKGSVDFFFDTMRQAVRYVSLVKPETGLVVSISTLPSGDQVAVVYPNTPRVLKVVLDVMDWYYRWRIQRWGVKYVFSFVDPKHSGERLAKLAEWMEDGKLRPVVGRTAKLEDLKAVIEGCQEVQRGKGGVGKFVVKMV